MTFGEKLLSLRKKENYSQEELAEKLGVSRQAVSRWESGDTMPDSPNLLSICRIFSVSADYLLRDEYAEPLELPGHEEKNDAEKVFFLACGGFLSAVSVLFYVSAFSELNIFIWFAGTFFLCMAIVGFVCAFRKK